MLRLFVGVELPDPVKQALVLAQGGVEGARWQTAEQLHLTLRFIGNVDRRVAEDVRDALARVAFAPFQVALAGVGLFGKPRSPRALYAGVVDPQPLKALRDRIEQALVRSGLEPERRKYKPHVTLARFAGRRPGRLESYLASHAGLTAKPFTLTRFALFSSHLSHNGARYEVIDGYPAGLQAMAGQDGVDLAEIAGPEQTQVDQQRP